MHTYIIFTEEVWFMVRAMYAIGLAVALLTMAASFSAIAQTKGQAKIVFLYVKMQHGSLSLIKTSVVNGTLKARVAATQQGDLCYEILTTAGQSVACEMVAAPTNAYYDVIQPDGSLSGGIKRLDEATFVIRVAYRDDLKSISFYKSCRESTPARTCAPGELKGDFIAGFPINVKGGRR